MKTREDQSEGKTRVKALRWKEGRVFEKQTKKNTNWPEHSKN